MSERETFNGHSIFTLSDVAMSIHKMIERTYNRQYYVKAEILKLNYYPYSGHCYPELVERDNGKIKAEMRAIIWSAKYKDINDRFLKITGEPLKENLSILCLVTIQFSPKHGLALHIEDVEPTFTLGEMEKSRLEVIERLKKDGVYNKNKTLKIPLLPKRIAVISVETSKGYSDFINTLRNNNRGYLFYTELFPSILQGDKAIIGMTHQLSEIKKRLSEFDVVVIVRGGGGDVGLSCYDDYNLSSAIATFPLPVLTGIGHSTNTSICDLVAFKSFITPTDVAFSLIEKYESFESKVDEYIVTIISKSKLRVIDEKKDLQTLISHFRLQSLRLLDVNNNIFLSLNQEILNSYRNIFSENKTKHSILINKVIGNMNRHLSLSINSLPNIYDNIVREVRNLLEKTDSEINYLSEKLQILSPENVLKRGYSITYYKGKAITDSSLLSSGDEIITHFYKGKIVSRVGE